jgi:hypothetical protein
VNEPITLNGTQLADMITAIVTAPPCDDCTGHPVIVVTADNSAPEHPHANTKPPYNRTPAPDR